MKILFLTPCVPTYSDGRRPYNFIKYLASRHDVHLLAMKYGVQTPCDIRRLQELGVRVTTVDYVPSQSVILCVCGLITGKPLRVSWCRSEEFKNSLSQLTSKNRFDLVHIDRMRMGQYARFIQAPKVLDFTDSLIMYLDRSYQFRRKWRERLIDRWERWRILPFERNVLQHVQAALVCSQVDAEVFKKYHPHFSFEVIKNAVDYNQFQPHSQGREHEPRCVITGTLFYFPNKDSIHFYYHSILPLIRRRYPKLETWFIGTRPSHDIRKLDGKHGIQILPDVPRMEEYLYQDDIYVCPLRVAAGIRNKLLEAMSAGMAIVTTPLGAEGLSLKDGKEVLMAETPEDFALQIDRLIKSPDLRRWLGKNAREYVIQHHDLERLGIQLEDVYSRLVEK